MKNFQLIKLFGAFLLIGCLTQCTVIKEGEVGVKRKLGKYSDKPYDEGLKVFNPLTTRVVKVSTQTNNMEVKLAIPSKEGLNIQSEVSILYNVIPNETPKLLREIGPGFERNVILPVFRSAVSDVSSRFYAKDMHTGKRAEIEVAIRDQMMTLLDGKGMQVEAVLLKSIKMPQSLAMAIEEKLEAEQQAQRMEFVLQEARQEADRKTIEATGVRDAQKIIAEGLDRNILQFKSIEAFLELSKSPNAKIIISDGDMPMLLGEDVKMEVPTSKDVKGTTTQTDLFRRN
ncbi:MAG: prohibitin family protein [Saprospiraceae bacterium]